MQLVKTRLYWSRVGPQSNVTRIFITGGDLRTDTSTGRAPCGDEAEVGVMLLQVKGGQGLPTNHQKLGGRLEQAVPLSPEREPTLLTL